MEESQATNRLFTVILEFEGTTSVGQVRAESAGDAFARWGKNILTPGSYGLTPGQAERLALGFEEEAKYRKAYAEMDIAPDSEPVPLNSVENVWCTTILTGDGSLALLNIVETVPEG
ncbi:MAG TPA: hypothetical protein VGG72_26240 [Bryobacteraceae bacterium]|jgi:hypothetical protein